MVGACCALAAVACGDDGDGDADGPAGGDGNDVEARPLDNELRLNDLQALGSHNSYHVEVQPEVMALLQAFDQELADSLAYSHVPLAEQFSEQGIRQIELDVFADTEGGRFADPGGVRLAGIEHDLGPEMAEPGFKVLHVQDIDNRSTCPTLVACLTEVRDWSVDNPGHLPIMVLVEVKQDPIPDPANAGFAIPEVIDAAALDRLDEEIREVFADEQVITPDDVRGDRASLEEAVLTDGWPTLAESRGKVLLALDNGGDVLDLYVADHPGLAGRMLFTSSPVGTAEAAFLKLNDPIADAAAIRQAVEDGYVVRTRADSDTAQARTGDTTVRDAALASGAQWISTDYPVDDPRFAPDYTATIPDGTPARCNPVRQPPGCTSADIEDPELLDVPSRGG